ncbi:MAG: hypothetical protein ABEJ56_00095 [Candidatus Nanohaloarchaea archaeon]
MSQEDVIFGGESSEESSTKGEGGFSSADKADKPRKRYSFSEKQVQIITQTAFKEARKQTAKENSESTEEIDFERHGETLKGFMDLYTEIIMDGITEKVMQQ